MSCSGRMTVHEALRSQAETYPCDSGLLKEF